jgi:mRNA interferase RelE/StbE
VTRYELFVKPSAKKEMDSLNAKFIARLLPKIEALIENPRPAGCTKLRGSRDLWRIRVGDYRVVYAIDDGGKRIEIMRVAHRNEVYN